LLYQSESDEPFTSFTWPAADVGRALSRKKVLTLGGHGAKERVEEQSPDESFGPLARYEDWFGAGERATADRYAKLAAAVANALDGTRVYRVGSGPEKTLYVVGHAESGDWVGLKTTAVET
jgi:histidine triad (HIT) family protein